MEVSDLLHDDELIDIIKKNNEEMEQIINENPECINDRKLKDIIDELFLENVDYCLEAFRRKLKVPNMSFMMAVATLLGYSNEDILSKRRNKLTKK